MRHLPLKTRAFTLVETLVAIAIIMVVLAAPFHTAEEAINAATISRDELIGGSLAQEGVEYVRSIRDNNFLYNQTYPSAPVSWLAGLDGTGSSLGSGTFTANCFTNACVVDPINSKVNQCSGTSCSTFGTLDLGTSLYSYPDVYNQAGVGSGNAASIFSRTIQLTALPTGTAPAVAHEVQVTVTVTWSESGAPHTTTVTEYLQNYL